MEPTEYGLFTLGKVFISNHLELAHELPSGGLHLRRHVMIAMLQFATLVITTMFATAAAVALQWLFLRAAFLMMQTATARRIPGRTELVRGTAQLARAFASQR
jgi:hypothetical protein